MLDQAQLLQRPVSHCVCHPAWCACDQLLQHHIILVVLSTGHKARVLSKANSLSPLLLAFCPQTADLIWFDLYVSLQLRDVFTAQAADLIKSSVAWVTTAWVQYSGNGAVGCTHCLVISVFCCCSNVLSVLSAPYPCPACMLQVLTICLLVVDPCHAALALLHGVIYLRSV